MLVAIKHKEPNISARFFDLFVMCKAYFWNGFISLWN